MTTTYDGSAPPVGELSTSEEHALMSSREFERTERGFVVYGRIRDRAGAEVRVQESSVAEEPCVWLAAMGVRGDGYALSLTVEQAREVRDALTAFIDEHEQEGQR